jgi:Aldehyde oxidase and xanthine dehydrogenase, a/b hammerhead domain
MTGGWPQYLRPPIESIGVPSVIWCQAAPGMVMRHLLGYNKRRLSPGARGVEETCTRIAAAMTVAGEYSPSSQSPTAEGTGMATYHVIGQPTRLVDGIDKTTGRARYAADVSLPGTLWGKSLHSTYAHARIVRIDTTAAQKVPGVHAVITGAYVRGGLWGRVVKDVPVLAYDRVRSFGERVAAVAAADEDIAQRALDLIEVEYKVPYNTRESLATAAGIPKERILFHHGHRPCAHRRAWARPYHLLRGADRGGRGRPRDRTGQVAALYHGP